MFGLFVLLSDINSVTVRTGQKKYEKNPKERSTEEKGWKNN
jgi:hypothetical protein